MTPVRFTRADFKFASQGGHDRRVSAIFDGRRGHDGIDDFDPWRVDVVGACAEFAVCKLLRANGFAIEWNPNVGRIDRHDLANFEVRSTRSTGCLCIKERDHDWTPYVGVVGGAAEDYTTWNILGWLFAFEGKQPRYWRDWRGNKRFNFFVPAADLRSMDSFLEWLRLPPEERDGSEAAARRFLERFEQ